MTDQTCRRAFLGSAVTTTAGLLYSAANDSAARAADPLYEGEIIDTHQHLWDLKEFKLPWIDQLKGKAKETLGRSCGLNDYAAAYQGLHVKRAVYMEVDVAENEQLKEVEFITKVCAGGKAPTVAAVVSGRPAAGRLQGLPGPT